MKPSSIDEPGARKRPRTGSRQKASSAPTATVPRPLHRGRPPRTNGFDGDGGSPQGWSDKRTHGIHPQRCATAYRRLDVGRPPRCRARTTPARRRRSASREAFGASTCSPGATSTTPTPEAPRSTPTSANGAGPTPGLDIVHRTSAAVGQPATADRNGYRVVRRGSRYSVFPRTIASELTRRMGRYDALVEVMNGVPFFSPVWCRRPRIAVPPPRPRPDVGPDPARPARGARSHARGSHRATDLPPRPDRDAVGGDP